MPAGITWVSMVPGTENEKPALPKEYADYLSSKPINPDIDQAQNLDA